MTIAGLLQLIADALARAGIPSMLTGSVAAAYYGAGRATMDVDLVVAPTRDQLASLVADLTARGLYVSIDAGLEAIEQERSFNVVDMESGWKADLIVRKSREFSSTEFGRRVQITYGGTSVWIATAEDVIVSKLEWATLGESSRQIEDVSALLRAQGDALDHVYIETWVGRLGLGAAWKTAQRT